jgi:hypothetical protein
MVFALAKVRPRKQFLQTDDVRSPFGRFANAGDGLLDIGLAGRGAGHLHEGDRNGLRLDVVVGHGELGFQVPG